MDEHSQQAGLERLLAQYQRNLQIVQGQIAHHGGKQYAPIELRNNQSETEREIAALQDALARFKPAARVVRVELHCSVEQQAAALELERALAHNEHLDVHVRTWPRIADSDAQALLEGVHVCLVLVSGYGLSAWRSETLRVAIERHTSNANLRVVPVLLPGARRGARSALPAFMRDNRWVEFRTSLHEAPTLRQLLRAIQGDQLLPTLRPAVDTNPYRGLRPFGAEHAAAFFGREAANDWLIDALQPPVISSTASRFLAIVGPSGSGKSSLAQAGLLNALGNNALAESANWPQAICTPGTHPIESLAIAVCSALGTPSLPAVRALANDLLADPASLHLAVRLALGNRSDTQRLVLLIDQFEELFTLCSDEVLRAATIAALMDAALAVDGKTIVLLTLRVDFYGSCARYPALAAALSERQMLIGPMSQEELRRAIEQPALDAGALFAPGLVDLLLADVRDQAGVLPLLQHALLELWQRRDVTLLTHAAYRSIGGVAGALQQRAELIFSAFSPAEQAICQRIFLRLVHPGEGFEDARQRVRLDTLLPSQDTAQQFERVLRTLAGEQARLITLSDEAITAGNTAALTERVPTAEIAHESLIRGWPRLREWLAENRAALRVHRRLTAAADEWQHARRKGDYLYRSAQLAEVEQLIPLAERSAVEQRFVRASQRAQQLATVRTGALPLLAVLLLVALLAVGVNYERNTRWAKVSGFPDNAVWHLAALNTSTPTYYAATKDIGIVRGPLPWQQSSQGLPLADQSANSDPAKNVRDTYLVAIDILDETRIYTYVPSNGIYASGDGGLSWAALGVPPQVEARLPDDADLLTLSVRADFMLVVNTNSQLYYRHNDEWHLVETTLPENGVWEAVIARDGITLYAAAEDGLYRSTVATPDAWEHVLVSAKIEQIEPSPTNNGLYYVTADDEGRSTVYYWHPDTKPQFLAELQLPVSDLAAHPGTNTPIVYVLTAYNEIWQVRAGFSKQLALEPAGLANDIVAVATSATSTQLLIANNKGLWEYRRSLP